MSKIKQKSSSKTLELGNPPPLPEKCPNIKVPRKVWFRIWPPFEKNQTETDFFSGWLPLAIRPSTRSLHDLRKRVFWIVTDRQTHRRTSQLNDWIGPVGRFSENLPGSDLIRTWNSGDQEVKFWISGAGVQDIKRLTSGDPEVEFRISVDGVQKIRMWSSGYQKVEFRRSRDGFQEIRM